MKAFRSPHRLPTEEIGYVIAGIGPIVVAALLVPVRDDLVNTNLALILVVVVVLAAMAGGRGPGLLAAVVTTMSYDFFLTRPYLSLRIDSTDDIETTVILLVIGLLVGQLVVSARRSRRAAARGADEVARLHRVAEQAASGVPVEDIVRSVETELSGLLGLRECTFERPPFGSELPLLERTGAISGIRVRRYVGDAFALPVDGVALLVLGRGEEMGRLVLRPNADEGASLEERIVAVALSDQLGAALAAENAPSVSKEEET